MNHRLEIANPDGEGLAVGRVGGENVEDDCKRNLSSGVRSRSTSGHESRASESSTNRCVERNDTMTLGTELTPEARAFLYSIPVGVLSTVRKDGRARQSTVFFVLEHSTIWISTEAGRAKTQDVIRSGWASFCVVGPAAPYPSVTVEGAATIQTKDVAPMTARIFARITGGDAPDLAEDDLSATGRVLLSLEIDRVYGASYLDTPITG